METLMFFSLRYRLFIPLVLSVFLVRRRRAKQIPKLIVIDNNIIIKQSISFTPLIVI